MRDVNLYLLSAFNEILKEKKIKKLGQVDYLDILFDSRYEELFSSISNWLSEWPSFTDNLLKHNNWRISHLELDEAGKLRKPTAYLSLHVTSQKNLCLDWFPFDPNRVIDLEETDWLIWENIAPKGYMPFNRLLFLYGFGKYLYKSLYNNIDKYLMQAVNNLIDNIITYLRTFIDIRLINNLYLDFENTEIGAKLINCRIRDTKEVEEEIKEQWLQKTFNDSLKITPAEFLEIYKSSDMKYAPTARTLFNKIKLPVSTDRIKKLIIKLYEEYPAVYDAVLINNVPKGAVERKVGVVLPFIRI